MIVLSNADISGLYLVQSVDCGVHHHCGTTTAVPSHTLQHIVTYSYTHCPAKMRTDSGKHINGIERDTASLLHKYHFNHTHNFANKEITA
jgi:hypothetical protein